MKRRGHGEAGGLRCIATSALHPRAVASASRVTSSDTAGVGVELVDQNDEEKRAAS